MKETKTKKTENCGDQKCVNHGKVPARGRTFTGKITKTTLSRSAKVEFSYFVPLKKYERLTKRFTRLHAHNPNCINAKVGDTVKVAETRKLSKTKNFVIIQKIK